MITPDNIKLKIASRENTARQDRMHLLHSIDSKTIRILERKFGTKKACFLRTPSGYDPLDAMRRDAYREVIQWIKTQIALARKENQ